MLNQNIDSPQQIPATGGTIVVLLVDDQRFVGIALERLFATEPDIELHCCQNAGDAIALANQIRPTIILQDLVLPDIDGLTMVRLFRTNLRTAATPVIVLSGNDHPDTRARALAEGAADYLVKLPQKSDLLACVRRHAVMAVGAGTGTARLTQPIPRSSDGADETLDRTVIAEFRQATAEGAPDITRALIDGFMKEAASHVEVLRDARQRMDVETLTSTAHSLKGSSMTMGARRLAALCAQVEDQVTRNPGGAITLDLMTDVDRELDKVRNALEAEQQGSTQL